MPRIAHERYKYYPIGGRDFPIVNKRRNEWIKYYVEANCCDGKSMNFLFGIVCNLPEEQRLPSIVTFCQCNPAFDAFRSIHILPTHASWSGSEVPILEQRIAFLIELTQFIRRPNSMNRSSLMI